MVRARALGTHDSLSLAHHDALVALAAVIANIFVNRHFDCHLVKTLLSTTRAMQDAHTAIANTNTNDPNRHRSDPK